MGTAGSLSAHHRGCNELVGAPFWKVLVARGSCKPPTSSCQAYAGAADSGKSHSKHRQHRPAECGLDRIEEVSIRRGGSRDAVLVAGRKRAGYQACLAGRAISTDRYAQGWLDF